MDDDYDEADHGPHDLLAAGDDEADCALKMTVKVPPPFDGHVQTNSYFAMKNHLKSGNL